MEIIMRVIIKITDEEKDKMVIDSIVAASNLDKSMKLVESYFAMGKFIFSNEAQVEDNGEEQVNRNLYQTDV
jgi:hypothetical protein